MCVCTKNKSYHTLLQHSQPKFPTQLIARVLTCFFLLLDFRIYSFIRTEFSHFLRIYLLRVFSHQIIVRIYQSLVLISPISFFHIQQRRWIFDECMQLIANHILRSNAFSNKVRNLYYFNGYVLPPYLPLAKRTHLGSS